MRFGSSRVRQRVKQEPQQSRLPQTVAKLAALSLLVASCSSSNPTPSTWNGTYDLQLAVPSCTGSEAGAEGKAMLALIPAKTVVMDDSILMLLSNVEVPIEAGHAAYVIHPGGQQETLTASYFFEATTSSGQGASVTGNYDLKHYAVNADGSVGQMNANCMMTFNGTRS